MRLFRLAIPALVLLGAVASAQAAAKWIAFEPAGDGYRIDFPGTPTVKRDTTQSRVGPAPHVEAALSAKGYSYSVDLTTYASASDPKAVLDLFATTIANAGKVRKQTPLKVGPDMARRFDVELADGKVIDTMLVVTDGTRVYIVSCTASRGQESSASVKHFISSFALAQQ
ncbi:hypothetical protein [Mesorhizobium loti]|uniref:hypothetical protein n=1 Tax=Rhizobium loti TaxID=381 RepID=UPI001269129E|nr:hypothetical protein [Mesorhizobium loti]